MTNEQLSEERHKPPSVWKMRFCPKCGRDDLHTRLEARHFSGGQLCGGKLAMVTYGIRITGNAYFQATYEPVTD